MSALRSRQAPKSKPLSVRFTDAEKARLLELAGKRPLGIFIREKILGGEAVIRKARQQPRADTEQLGSPLQQLIEAKPLDHDSCDVLASFDSSQYRNSLSVTAMAATGKADS